MPLTPPHPTPLPPCSGMAEFIGIFVGHVYYFLKYQYPETSGNDFLQTPGFL